MTRIQALALSIRLNLELGKGFAFVERQKRMIIDGEEIFI